MAGPSTRRAPNGRRWRPMLAALLGVAAVALLISLAVVLVGEEEAQAPAGATSAARQ